MSNREALWGVSEKYGNAVLNTLGGIALYKTTNWFRNHYKNIKTGLDTYYAIKPKTQMARFKRRGFKRRRVSRRYGRKRRFYGAKRLARRVSSISRMLRSKGVRNTEIKYHEISGKTNANRPTTSVPAVKCLTADISQGTGNEDRIGAKIFIRKVNLQFQLRANNLSTSPETYVRILLIRDKQPASPTVGPIYADLFKFPQALPASADPDQSPSTMAMTMMTRKHTSNRIAGRFQWLHDKWYKVSNEAGVGSEIITIRRHMSIFKPCFYGDLPSDGDRGPGHIYMFAISNDGRNTVTSHPAFDWSVRLSFTDV